MLSFSNILLITCIILAPCIALLATIIANRTIHTKPQKKKRKRLLVLLIAFLFIPLLTSAIFGLLVRNSADFINFIEETFLSWYYVVFLTLVIAFFLYGYFQKDSKKATGAEPKN